MEKLKELIEKQVDEKKILEGVGALIDDDKRAWARENLKKELLKKLAIEIKTL